jgi:hypothetical protein
MGWGQGTGSGLQLILYYVKIHKNILKMGDGVHFIMGVGSIN